ncbi:MAG: ABC-three component system protein, partial [Anaerovorax sp.]|nr:ABC-three component system protein [Anaerovorax sp.]
VQDHKANSNTTEYQYYELLELIKGTFKKYPNSVRTDCVNGDCVSCTSTDQCNLYQQMFVISNKSYEDKKDFLYKLLLRTPQNNLPRDAVINNLFITLLKKIKCLKYYNSNVILAEKNKEVYRLTLDENEYIEDFETQLHKELSFNNADKFLIYESDVLITDRLNMPDYRYNQNNFNVMGANELEEIVDITSDSVERQRINYNKSKVMRIISKDIAEGELKDNE